MWTHSSKRPQTPQEKPTKRNRSGTPDFFFFYRDCSTWISNAVWSGYLRYPRISSMSNKRRLWKSLLCGSVREGHVGDPPSAWAVDARDLHLQFFSSSEGLAHLPPPRARLSLRVSLVQRCLFKREVALQVNGKITGKLRSFPTVLNENRSKGKLS